jgi:hypothetical protein
MSQPINFPAISEANLSNARLYANRHDMAANLGMTAKGGVIAEIGVGLGDFSQFLLEALSPKRFVGFDTFRLHEIETLWGRDSKDIFQGNSHFDFYKHRMSKFGEVVVAEEGFSHETLSKYPNRYFDFIYVDAEHTYDEVKRDADIASMKLVDNGLIIFNDYIMYDHVQNCPYGVVPVVNEMVANDGWKVVGFALQQHMFCDIAVRRS